MKVGVVVSEWNSDITENLLRGALETLTESGLTLDNIHIIHVPGSFELAQGALMLLDNKSVEAVICLGSIIKGETPHFGFISVACAQGIQSLALKSGKPIIFGVLTDNTLEQAQARSGGAMGNKGVEAAITAIRMIALKRDLQNSWVL